ncbi:MAG: CDP-diacylglycerol--glycerol-3-phosphate 3-phosphatidyltransferase [Candidatus Omnitrophica bacterium]|nr:CDP-diacylglycerol--glycerol-3-phosphate 3-phosphatidyltransferase [Candidatus Omnitrophota bacterium]
MNLPNKLTVFRIILTIIFVWIVVLEGLTAKIFAALLFTAASVTDFLDGYLARKHNLISNFGKIMDPIADKCLILSAFYVFAHMQLIAWWMFVLVAIREVWITAWRLHAILKGRVLAAETLGKYKTVAQIVTISITLIFLILKETKMSLGWSNNVFFGWLNFIYYLMFGVVLITLISGISFLRNNRRSSDG